MFNVMFQVFMKIMMFFWQFPEHVDALMFVFFSKLLLNMTSQHLRKFPNCMGVPPLTITCERFQRL